MDKMKELIETWNKFYEYLEYNNFMIASAFDGIYVDFIEAEKEFENFKTLCEKIDEIIKSLEVDENATAH